MKNLCLFSIPKRIFFQITFLLLINFFSFSQEDVTWAAHPLVNNSINGTTPSGIIVTANRDGLNNNLTFPANPLASTSFQARGPWPNATTVAADDLVFSFSSPVIVTELIITDINTSIGGWNDSFDFDNDDNTFAFNLFQSNQGCCVSNNGVNLITGSAPNVNSSSWFCSTSVLTNFRLHFFLINGLTTAWLNYRLRVIEIPNINPICLNSPAPNFPVIGNNIQGTWSPEVIDTSVSGDFVYTFTPNAGQSLTCPVPINVTILPANDPNCCQNSLNLVNSINNVSNLSLPINGVRHREASNWITATNIVNVGDNSFQNGVVYHAGDYVELNPGFEAVFGSQFSGYIEGCSETYVYRTASQPLDTSNEIFQSRSLKRAKHFSIIPNPSSNSIEIKMANTALKKVNITSIYGKTVYEKSVDNQDAIQIDISSYEKGLYLVTIMTDDGQVLSEKLIKN